AAHGAEERQRLVLGPAVDGIDLEIGIADLDHALALDHARVAGVALLEDRLHHRGAVDLAGLLERAFRVVARGLAAHLVLYAQHAGRAVLAEPGDTRIDLLHLLEPLGELAELVRHRRLGRLAAAHHDRLEPLAA